MKIILLAFALLAGAMNAQDLYPTTEKVTPAERLALADIERGSMSVSPMSTVVPDTPPILANFTWSNQNACIGVTNPSGTVTMFHPGAAGLGFNWCSLLEPLPAAPYSAYTKLRGHLLGKAASLAFVLQDSVSGKMVIYSIGASDTGIASIAGWKMLSPTVYQTPNSPYFTFSNGQAIGGLLPEYLRIKDNGSIRTFAITDEHREVWFTISAVLNNDFMVPTHVGFALRGTGDNLASIMTIKHYAVTTP